MKHPFSDVAAFQHDATGLFMRDCRDGEPLKRLHLGFAPAFQVTDPVLVKPILKADESLIDKGRMVHKLRAVVGMSSLTISGPENVRRRAATHDQLKRGFSGGFVPMICEIYRDAMKGILAEGDVELHGVTAPLALRVICSVLFGRGVLTAGDEAAIIACVKLVEDDLADSIARLMPNMPIEAMRRRKRLKWALESMSFVVARARHRATERSLLAALETLELSDDDLRDELLMLLLAGHHTTGTAGAWMLYHLASEPDLAEAVAEEGRAALDADGWIDAKRLVRCETSASVVRETLRLYPSSYWFARETLCDQDLAERRLKKGTSLIISPWQMHRDARFWDEPDRFRIGRDYASKAYIPFGNGPRTCVGIQVAMLELQLLALETSMAMETRVKSAPPAPAPKASITLVPPPIVVTVRARRFAPVRYAA